MISGRTEYRMSQQIPIYGKIKTVPNQQPADIVGIVFVPGHVCCLQQVCISSDVASGYFQQNDDKATSIPWSTAAKGFFGLYILFSDPAIYICLLVYPTKSHQTNIEWLLNQCDIYHPSSEFHTFGRFLTSTTEVCDESMGGWFFDILHQLIGW